MLSPSLSRSPERLPEREKLPEPASQREEEEGDADEDEGDSDAGQDDQLMVPRVKVAEDGSLIIDEERLVSFREGGEKGSRVSSRFEFLRHLSYERDTGI